MTYIVVILLVMLASLVIAGLMAGHSAEKDLKRVVRDGQVAVLVSPGYGAGWSTWADDATAAVFDPAVVAWVEEGKPDIDLDLAFGHHGYLGGLADVEVWWVPVGSRFIVDEYDGSESLTIIGPDFGFIA